MDTHYVIDHTKPLAAQAEDLKPPPVKYVASLTGTARNFAQLVEVLAPEGKIGVIDDPESLDAVPLKRKAAALHWEFMFARSMWQTADMVEHGGAEPCFGTCRSGRTALNADADVQPDQRRESEEGPCNRRERQGNR